MVMPGILSCAFPPIHSGVTQIDRVVEAVEETLRGNTVSLLAKKALPRLDLPKVCNTCVWRISKQPRAPTTRCRD